MDFLLSVPYIARIVLSLLAILIFQKVVKRLEVAMLFGVLILAAWTGHSPSDTAAIASGRMFSADTFFLVFVIAGVIWLSSLMSETGLMKDLVVSLKSRLASRALLATLPAVVGLLPMPAGAYFSAPLIDDADVGKELSPDRKSNINYWFRHIWEFWWPLYPGILLAVDLSGVAIWFFVVMMSPLFLTAVVAGYIFLLRSIPPGKVQPRGDDHKAFIPLILPILTVIAVYIILLFLTPGLAACNKYLPMAVGVVAGIVVLQVEHPVSPAVWKRVVFSYRTLSLMLLIVLSRIYGAFIEARLDDGHLLMEKVRFELDVFGIPALLLVIVIPFVSGLSTGIAVGFVGASFPVVLSLAQATDFGFYATMILGYSSGYLGMMLSPIHVCLIVTNEYFETKLGRSLTGVLGPCIFLFIFVLLYSGFWSWMEST